jgi:acyl-coenzyme A synthetase/AMP-(fatty) acid ligase
MKMRQQPRPPESWPPATLREAVADSDALLHGRNGTAWQIGAAPGLNALAGASVLLRTKSQAATALGLIALDGAARRIVIAPPDVNTDHLPLVVARAAIDTVVSDDVALAVAGTRFMRLNMDAVSAKPTDLPTERVNNKPTEWVLFTSGTTGAPKMVAHALAGLAGAIKPGADAAIVWGTFYDIRRYGGLQILLRALLGRTALILSDADESVADFLTRLGLLGVTHLTGTPSHWRRVLMSPASAAITPRYVRLSGEIADQAILDALKARFPDAAIGHAYASTEAGVGFAVTDGLAGFPASYVGGSGPVEMKVEDGRLHLRSSRAASGYVGNDLPLRHDGWVDSGDLVTLRGDRYYFQGRVGGIINVGGLKISPEEVEAVINHHPGVRACRVSGRKSPITGAIVVADVVLADPANDDAAFHESILAACRQVLPPFKVPALLRVVDHLALSANGKLCRTQDIRHA